MERFVRRRVVNEKKVKYYSLAKSARGNLIRNLEGKRKGGRSIRQKKAAGIFFCLLKVRRAPVVAYRDPLIWLTECFCERWRQRTP